MGISPKDYAASDKKTEQDMREALASLDVMFGEVGEDDHEATVELEMVAIRLRIPQYPSVGEALGMDDLPSDGQFEDSMEILGDLWLKHFESWEGGKRAKHIGECMKAEDQGWYRRPHSCPRCFYDRLEALQQWSWIARAFINNMDSAVNWARRKKDS